MAIRLFLDTNVFIDALAQREPYCEKAKLILALGMLGEFELWFSASQATDIYYVLSDGGKPRNAQWATEQLAKLRAFVRACSFTEEDIDGAIASTWKDFEDACINQVVHKVKPDAVVTGNTTDFALSDFPVFNCDALFAWIEQKYGISYCEIAWPKAERADT
jgi:predicted nucleic acid-binding protein